MKTRFGIDIDGTVTCPTAILPYINKAFGLNITLDDVIQYELDPLVDITKEEFAQWYLQNEQTIYAESPLAEGAKNVLKSWENKYELYFISARDPYLLPLTKDWFLQQELRFDHIHLLGSHNKIAAAKQFNVDVFFEDKHDNAVMIHKECGIPVVLFDTPYNREPIPNGVIRVQNWEEAAEWIDHWFDTAKALQG
ncbi:5' nucleotidase, NT5C type [Bacillus benzoevorans]|uniref:Nucleotidase n=1 Tax=Bacillus benzoevorans TaxID=1456 RepID=A0A7X0HSE1_9BACI|nr:hypothetical protein [Bacillus benzoevorans]MBB6446010.1 hypothetical protein [Bacillus benzoevorans]